MQRREDIRNILLSTLKNFWGYDNFRDSQEEIIFSILDRKDTLALLPTGGGKSICYQLPALVLEGVCLVISPLLALMRDQIIQLKELGIEAEYLSSELDEIEQEMIYERAMRGDIKLLYISPERLANSVFLKKILDIPLSFIAVDEAHCISEWGQDFRPSYQYIRDFRKVVGDLPCLALTATATPKVVADIEEKLSLEALQIFRKSYQRENLRIFNEELTDKYQRIFDFLRFNQESGIIYVRTRKDAEDLALFLKQKGIQCVDFYHAGLSAQEKNKKQIKWQMSDRDVLVSTNAFGMGIDKDNVRFVIHFSPSMSIESYYQEIGRAGRDGQESNAFLFWNERELKDIDDVLYHQIPNKTEFLKIIYSLYSKFQIAEYENSEMVFQFDLKKIQQSTRLSYAKIRNVLNFLNNQGIVYWNNYNAPSTVKLKIDIDDLDLLPPKDAYFVELLLRCLPGVGMGKVSFNEKTLSDKFEIGVEDIRKRLLSLEEKGILEYINGQEDSLKFLSYRNDRELEGKIWKLFEKIQKNKLQKWEEMKYFIRNKDFCKMRMILTYFGEKNSIDCGKCYICNSSADGKHLENEVMEILKKSPASFDELQTKMYYCEKEQLFDYLISLLNRGKIKMLNYKTYIINE